MIDNEIYPAPEGKADVSRAVRERLANAELVEIRTAILRQNIEQKALNEAMELASIAHRHRLGAALVALQDQEANDQVEPE